MSENEEEKKDDFEQSTALSLRQINANKSIKDIENKCKFDKYDRNKFDTNAKQKTKESQFKQGGKQYDPISGEEIVLTQKEAKERWGDDWTKHSAEGDHIDPLERVYEKGKDMAFVTETDVKEVANQESNIIAVSKETNTRKGNKTNEEFVNQQKHNYSEQGKQNAIKLQNGAEIRNDEQLKQRNISRCKKNLKTSVKNSVVSTSITTGVFSGIQNARLVKEGKKRNN